MRNVSAGNSTRYVPSGSGVVCMHTYAPIYINRATHLARDEPSDGGNNGESSLARVFTKSVQASHLPHSASCAFFFHLHC